MQGYKSSLEEEDFIAACPDDPTKTMLIAPYTFAEEHALQKKRSVRILVFEGYIECVHRIRQDHHRLGLGNSGA